MSQVLKSWMNIFDRNLLPSFGFILVFIFFGSACANKGISKEPLVSDVALDEAEFIPPCNNPLTEVSFANAEKFLTKETKPLKRMDLAKQLALTECLTVFQLIRISRIFSLEQEVLDFAVYAYPYCYNPASYFLFEKEMSLESNKQKLKDFLK